MIPHGKKLGKLPKKHDARNLKLATYLPQLPIVPGAVDWAAWVHAWGLFRNGDLGDCTCASLAHAIQSWTANALGEDSMVTVPDQAVVDMYSAISGYDPRYPSTDQGAYCLDALRHIRKTGLGGHKIEAFAEIDYHKHGLLRAAVWLFGAVYIGATLYDDIWDSEVWDAPKPGTRIAGGHAMVLVRFGKNGLAVPTWGALQPVTWAWVDSCVDESYALLSTDSLDKAGQSVAGFKLDALREDLGMVTR